MKRRHFSLIVFLACFVSTAIPAETQRTSRRAYNPGGLLGIAMLDSAQKDIGIETDVEKLRRIQELSDSAQKEVREVVDKADKGQPAELQASINEVREKKDMDLLNLLTPKEGIRLQQIHWQIMGWRAPISPKLARCRGKRAFGLSLIRILAVKALPRA